MADHDMNKILVYSPLRNHTTSTSDFMIFRGLDVKVAFSNTDVFSFTASPDEADIVCMSASTFANQLGHLPRSSAGNFDVGTQTKAHLFCSQFSNAKLFVDINHLMHVGEGVSDLTRVVAESNALAELFKQAGVPDVVTIFTNIAYIHEHNSMPDHLLYTDFLWNRQLSFYKYQPDTVFKSSPDDVTSHWYPTEFDSSVYELSDLDEVCSHKYINTVLTSVNDSLHKTFVSPCRTRGASVLRRYQSGYADPEQPVNYGPGTRDFLRTQLIMLLRNYPGYIGDSASGNFLVGQGVSEQRLQAQISVRGSLGWTPIHNEYYANSVLSIYTETITMTMTSANWPSGIELRNLTEKTWEPLIKGHFILPFGYQGMIQDLRTHYGVMFPDWIDYTYDECNNDLERWFMYTQEITRVLAMGSRTLFNYKQRDSHILKHNRDLLLDRGYRDTIESALMPYVTNKPELTHLAEILRSHNQ